MRTSLPDYHKVSAAYLNKDLQFFDLLDAPSLIPGLEAEDVALADYLSYAVLEYGDHRYLWDAKKLFIVLTKLDFSSASASKYLPGVDPSSERRRTYSFYVEATK